jgi:hypothetical protein
MSDVQIGRLWSMMLLLVGIAAATRGLVQATG